MSFLIVNQLYSWQTRANLIDVGVLERLEYARQKYSSHSQQSKFASDTFRHSYGFEPDWDKLRLVARKLEKTATVFHIQTEAFMERLEVLGSG